MSGCSTISCVGYHSESSPFHGRSCSSSTYKRKLVGWEKNKLVSNPCALADLQRVVVVCMYLAWAVAHNKRELNVNNCQNWLSTLTWKDCFVFVACPYNQKANQITRGSCMARHSNKHEEETCLQIVLMVGFPLRTQTDEWYPKVRLDWKWNYKIECSNPWATDEPKLFYGSSGNKRLEKS